MYIALNTVLPYAAGILFIGILAIIIWLSKSKKTQAPLHYFEPLIEALGGIENILKLEDIQKRVRVELNDVKKVQANALNALKIAAVLKGNTVTVLVPLGGSTFIQYVENKKGK